MPYLLCPRVRLTVGSAAGAIRELFTKVQAIDAKHGKFDLVLCTGDFFGLAKGEGEEYTDEDDVMQLLNGALDAPMECFIMQGEHALPQPVIEKFAKTGGQLSKNVFLLHKSGVMTTAHGLRVACLGGIFDQNLYSVSDSVHGFTSPFFTGATVEKLLANAMTQTATSSKAKDNTYGSLAAIMASTAASQNIDILLTNTFPSNITAFSSAPRPAPNFPSPPGADPVSEVVRRTKPRYHFVAGGGGEGDVPLFWEREPVVWEEESARVLRFVSLGSFGKTPESGKKQRWFYAFSIAPQTPTTPPPSRPANATRNPFTERIPHGQKRPLQNDDGENFRWGTVQGGNKRGRPNGGEPGKPPPGYKCKICESADHFISDCPDRAKPHEGYVCKVCKGTDHFVRDCPVKNAVGDTGGKKPREGYVCRACGSENHYIQDCSSAVAKPRGGPRVKEIAPDSCWFCLSNPNLAKHLIVSIGTECYVTLPKGQIVPTHNASDYNTARVPSVPGGGHVLIVPITHYPTYATIPADLAGPIVDETTKYKAALHSLYGKHGAHPVAFEVGRLSAKGGHAHVQVAPVPSSLSAETIAEAFKTEGERLGIDFEFGDVNTQTGPGDRGYFKVDLPDGRHLVHWLKDGVPFSIQFGRQVLVELLGISERFDWKDCAQSEDDDKHDVEQFKTAFAPFDPCL